MGVGDSVVFIRGGGDQSLMIESRPQQPPANLWVQQPHDELTESSELASLGVTFRVTYYPGRRSCSPFVVPRGAVDEAMRKQWEPDMQVRMRPSDLVLRAGDTHGAATMEDTKGTIKAVITVPVWRNLQIDLDGSSSNSPPVTKNMWEVESLHPQPPVAKRTKKATDPGPSRDDESKEPVTALRLGIH
ncbi:B3 domain-containing protein Os07g0183300/Os07g0183600 [Lolium perenne]|uniref:B3 domain-containing protein Os07g0183300/Os07g0183600 n=1 Tax=Lolium perenne TaxID=4522 RepID=UPI0021F61B73|nr:auxin response factor 1-like [Lolium perenne]